MSDTPKTLRASQMPMALTCPASVRSTESDILIDSPHDAALLGTTVHAVLADVVRANLVQLPELEPYSKQYALPDAYHEDLEKLCAAGLYAWGELKQHFQVPKVEKSVSRAMDGWTLTGHADVYDSGPDYAVVLDWKTGRIERNYRDQMIAYAAMLCDGTSPTTSIVVNLRQRSFVVETFSRGDIDTWAKRVSECVVAWDGVYHPGEHCRFCRRRLTCDARVAMLKATARELGCDIAAQDPAKLLELYRRFRALEDAVESGKEQIKLLLESGVQIKDELEALILKTEKREKIDTLKSWPFMEAVLSEEEIASVVTVGKTALLKAVGNHAPGKGKGKYREDFMQGLRDAGAVEESTIQKLTIIVNGEEENG